MNRQSIIVILIGAIASFSGLATTDLLRSRRCREQLGTWTQAARECTLSSGTADTWTAGIAVAGLLIAAGVGFMLYRAYQFATGRARGLGSRQET